MKGASSIPKSPAHTRKTQVHSTVVQPHHEAPTAMEKIQTDSPTVQSMESVTEGQNKCSPDFQQPDDYVEPLEKEITDKGKNKDLNVTRNDNLSFLKPRLIPTQKETGPINSPINSVQQDCFLSKLAEIDEGLSKLSAVSTPNYKGSGKTHSSHIINEGVKVTARVCPGQGSENHAPNSEEATRQKEEKKQVQNQGTWKRKTNPAATQINKCNASKEELVLPTKRSHE